MALGTGLLSADGEASSRENLRSLGVVAVGLATLFVLFGWRSCSLLTNVPVLRAARPVGLPARQIGTPVDRDELLPMFYDILSAEKQLYDNNVKRPKEAEARILELITKVKQQVVTPICQKDKEVDTVIKMLQRSELRSVSEAAKGIKEMWRDNKAGRVRTDIGMTPSERRKAAKLIQSTTAAPHVRDPTRDKYVAAFADVLRKEKDCGNGTISSISDAMERAVFDLYGNMESEYKDKMRSLRFNLIQECNSALRRSLLLGEVAPGALVTMTDEELASASQKEEREVALKKLQDKHVVFEHGYLTETEMYRCSKCGKNRCNFYEKQTRSADEPMTIFVTCLECGHKWRDGSR